MDRVKYILVGVCLFFSMFAEGQSDKDHVEIIEKHLQTIAEGQHSAELYQHLGIAYFDQGDVGHAMLYFQKAKKLAPRNQKIIQSIELIRSDLPYQISDIPDFILIRWYRQLASIFTASTWSYLQLLFALGLLALMYLYWMKKRRGRGFSIGMIATAMCLFLTGVLTWQKHQMETCHSHGIVMELDTVRVAPDASSEEVVEVGPGNQVYILDEVSGWYQVMLRDRDTGWIPKEMVEVI